MKRGFDRWLVKVLAILGCSWSYAVSSHGLSFFHESEICEDTPLVLPEDEPEHLVSMTGKLTLHVLLSESEDSADTFPIYCPVLELNPESFKTACSTPVRASFQTPASIQSFQNCGELALTGDYDQKWIEDHIDQTVTVEGYLWHAHTGHHLTPILMDFEPWSK